MKISQLKVNQINWSDKRKVESRYQTIVKPYRDIFGQSIPSTGQYWTMCGQCADPNGNLIRGCEIDQMITSEIITPEQFHGVEKNYEIYKLNKMLPISANFYYDDFYNAMKKASNENKFNPSIVFADLIHMPKKGTYDISKIMFNLLTSSNFAVLLACNLVLKIYSNRTALPEDIINELCKKHSFNHVWSTGLWKMYDKVYLYNGSTRSHSTWLGTVIFYKK